MKYLLDTCVVLWMLDDVKQLKKPVQTILENLENELYLSTASIWELAIKHKIGRIHIPVNFMDILNENQIEILDIIPRDAFLTADLPDIHQDPFDRIIIAQAKHRQLTVITRDKHILKYPIKTLVT